MSKAMMRAIESRPGEALRVIELPRPVPGPGQVLIRVRAAGVNRPDLIQRAGRYPPPAGAPDTLGLEVSGEIAAVGPGVEGWRAGDDVCALLPGGGYAEYALAHAGSVLPVPRGLDLADAAGLPETVFTVWSNVFVSGRLKAGERFLVHGGASGIGTTAIQIASALGAEVYATAGHDTKCRQCEALGAVRAFNYRQESFDEALGRTGGVDVILDMVGKPYFQRNLSILRDEGRLVYIAFLEGSAVEGDLMRLMLKRLTITGSTLRARPDAFKAQLADQVRTHVWPLIESGRFAPRIDSTFPLERAEEAHTRMQSGDHIGKILLTM